MERAAFPPAGLIVAGNVSGSWMTRWRSLRRWLGPVISFDNRVTARAASTLRAGYAVHDWTAFEKVRLLLISVPDDRLPEAVEELLALDITWGGVSVILCDSGLNSRALAPLAQRGAAVASVSEFLETDVERLLAEGDCAALSLLKQCLEGSSLRLMEVSTESKPLFLSALSLLAMSFPAYAAAIDLMRRAGFSGEMSTAIAERTVQRLARAARNGRKGLSGLLATGRRKDLDHHLAALDSVDPLLHHYFVESAILGLQLMRSNPQLAEELRLTRRPASLAASA